MGSCGPAIEIANGTLLGSRSTTNDLDLFLGIPYAAPPVGDLRLRTPTPHDGWNGIRDATSHGPWCFGNPINLQGFSQNFTKTMSEDCLHINIIRPAGVNATARLPVVAWIHGGAFADGSAADERADGTFLVQRSIAMETPVIFASFNYRLGQFGMIAGSVSRQAGVTNLNLRDQRQALRWIQENVEAFGGDPSRVTIMGESAGAGSVGFHLLAFGGRDEGLFSAAIIQSGGPFMHAVVSRSVAEQDQDFNSVLTATGCTGAQDPLTCLRSVPAEALNSAGARLPPSVDVDGDLIPESTIDAMREGRFVPVPLLAGSNLNEGTAFVLQRSTSPINTDQDFQAFVRGILGGIDVEDDIIQNWTRLYQDEVDNPSAAGLGTVEANPGPTLGALYGKTTLWMGDFMFTACRRVANQAWAAQGIPSYGFLFDAVPANHDAKTVGVAHFMEIPYTFGNTGSKGWEGDPFPADPTEREKHLQLVELMSSMWISFVTSGTPNSHKIQGFDVDWPVYNNTDPTHMQFSALDGSRMEADTWRSEAIELFAKIASNAPSAQE
ncbi:Alpha/Beta hydrolase protein [Plectosphaerella cucumerina]|uniref:Carboxylic ester hydrolase n=1 Tax=Plectosphaerella cucumerina TaxID=40658 RepID=A0A8K0T4U9_9PEZI|nr:Alpha/Beta hydrolase protein [Plectosphaerella cucumerina]